jgi:YbbR domain-containing protein
MGDFFRKYIWHNLGMKFVSVLVAAMMWFGVGRDPIAEVAVNVPIEFHHVPENLEISSDSIPQAQVRVRGPVHRIRDLAQAQIHAVIDLNGVTPGERTFDLTAHHISVPRNTEVVQVVPTQFRLNFDRRISREIEVRPRVLGTFPPGFHLQSATTDPAIITVVGPEHRVKALESAMTDPVDATGVIGRATFTTNVYVSDPLIRVTRNESVHVTVVTERTQR